MPAVFDHGVPGDPPPAPQARLALRGCEALPSGVVRLRYDVDWADA